MELGLLVESHSGKAIVEPLARRLVPRCVGIRTFRHSRSSMNSAYITVIEMTPQGIDHFFCVFDGNSTVPKEVEARKVRIAHPLVTNGVFDRVTLCPAVPDVEEWVRLGLPEGSPDAPKGKYDWPLWMDLKEIDERIAQIQRVVQRIDPAVVAARSPSFADFARAVTGYAARAQPAVAAR